MLTAPDLIPLFEEGGFVPPLSHLLRINCLTQGQKYAIRGAYLLIMGGANRMVEERELEALRLTDPREITNEEISSRTEKLRNQAKAQIIKTQKYHFLAKKAKMKFERYQEIYAELPATIKVKVSEKGKQSAVPEKQKNISQTAVKEFSSQNLSETSSIGKAAKAQIASQTPAPATAAKMQEKSSASPETSARGKSMAGADKSATSKPIAPRAIPPASNQNTQAAAEPKPLIQETSIPNPKKALVEELMKQAEQAYQHWSQLANQEYQSALQQRLAYEQFNSSRYSN